MALSVVVIVICALSLLCLGSVYADQLATLADSAESYREVLTELRIVKTAAVAAISALVSAVVFLFRSLQVAQKERVEALQASIVKRDAEVERITSALSENTSTQRAMTEGLDRLTQAIKEASPLQR